MSETTILELARREPWNYGGALLSMVDALRAENAALKRDAERYRWIREHISESERTDEYIDSELERRP